MKNKMNILIIGHGGAGKSTVALLLQDLYALTFKDSSEAAAELFIYEALKDKYEYSSAQECYADRRNHRDEWYNLIREYNAEDDSRLAKEILKTNNIYVGMRDWEELKACREENLFQLIIGVYNPYMPPELTSSFNLDIWRESDIIIPNLGEGEPFEKLVNRVKKLTPLFVPHEDIDEL